MIPNSFEYKKADSVSSALGLLNEDAKILAGGQSLIPAMKLRLNNPETLIDIASIEGLKGISDQGNSIRIGAATTHAEIARSSDLAEHAPMFCIAAETIGDVQVRNKGTIGGSMAHADPAADWPAVLIASGATVQISGPSGSRDVNIDDFFTGFYETALEENEIITGVTIPKNSANKHSTYSKFKQPASRFAIVGCAAAATVSNGVVNEIRIALTGVSDRAYRVTGVEQSINGKSLDAASIAKAVSTGVTSGQDILSDHYASEEYRAHLAQVYTKKALMALV